MSLYKIPLLLASYGGTYISLTPPNPPIPQNTKAKGVSSRERVFSAVVRRYNGLLKVLYFLYAWLIVGLNDRRPGQMVLSSGALLEVAVILARQWPSHPISQKILTALIRGPASLADRIELSPMFFAGCTVSTICTLIRYRCYRELGRLFTYEMSIQSEHKLVTQGPYSVVRHPSYPTVIACVVGLGMCYAAKGSWVRECGVMDTTSGRAVAGLATMLWAYGSWNAIARTSDEDALLKAKFGTQWDEWAKRVPYKLIPFIY
ncbi:uncharacterized protein FIBRA_08462 [Fibroporia radiculosa]|uniref:Protein-S-isoprenylcysteine O-methyltransferase n=1 Tax=Fibroporia radiculosa TaxID=599839 RepID=J4I2S8_9APHY|nr:uncharacterized protein FIBRA_08462 [Fibroporia radiculosa]CCM06217.1 predicted protein [Fibroporia radiculosa]